MPLIKVRNVQVELAVGLTWRVLRGATTEKTEIKEIASAVGSKLGCLVTSRSVKSVIVGLSPDIKTGSYSGAAWLALASADQPILLVEEVREDLYWLCAVKAGHPIQGLDKLVKGEGLVKAVEDAIGTDPALKIHSTSDEIDEAFSLVQAKTFDEICRSLNGGAPPAQAKIKRLAGSNPWVAGGGVVLTVGLFAWPHVQDYWKDHEAQVRRRLDARSQQESDLKRQADAAAAAQLLRQAQDDQVRQAVLLRPAPEAQVDAFIEAFGAPQMIVGGWQPETIDCTSQNLCTLIWKRLVGGTTQSFLEAAEAASIRVLKVEDDTASTVHQVSVEARAGQLEDLRPQAVMKAALDTQLQGLRDMRIGTKFTADRDDAALIDMALSASAPGPAASAPASPWNIKPITVDGTGLIQAQVAAHALSHPAVAIRSFSANIQTEKWKLVLSYASK